MKILIVDDMETRHELIAGWLSTVTDEILEIYCVFSVEEAEDVFSDCYEFDYIFLDHDLGGPEFMLSDEYQTGCTVADMIVARNIQYKEIVVHSINLHGAMNIQYRLPQSVIIPFFTLVTMNTLPGNVFNH